MHILKRKNKLGRNVKSRRKSLGLTLEKLAKACGSSKSHIWEIEKGRTNPSVFFCQTLAGCLGCTVDSLLGENTYREAQEIQKLREENERLKVAIKPFADCADELDGNEYRPAPPDEEWAKFRLVVSDYRKARAALKGGE